MHPRTIVWNQIGGPKPYQNPSPAPSAEAKHRWLPVASMMHPEDAASRQLLQFFAAVVFFHGSEYALAVAVHGKSNVNLTSLLVSKQYVIAMSCAVIEYIAELFLFPDLKERWLLSSVGLMMVVLGELIRKIGILTARRAFTHNIKIYHEEHHELVTHGIYRICATSFCFFSEELHWLIKDKAFRYLLVYDVFFMCYRFMRHPGYCGFFVWAVGTQLMICNPFCIVAFTVVLWRFFYKRIPYPLSYLHLQSVNCFPNFLFLLSCYMYRDLFWLFHFWSLGVCDL